MTYLDSLFCDLGTIVSVFNMIGIGSICKRQTSGPA
jgi:hypothetical protein